MKPPQITNFVRFAAGALLGLCSWGIADAGLATSVNGLYYTGVNDSGGLLTGGSRDSHWTVIDSNKGSTYEGAGYVVNSSYIDGAWVQNTSSAQWITAPGAQTTSGTVNVGGDMLPGTSSSNASYVYKLSFNIAGSGNAGEKVTNQISITLTLAADDLAKIYVNPTLTNGQITSGTVAGSITSGSPWTNTSAITLQNFDTSKNANFVIGTNTLVIEVDNTGSATLNPSGLLVYQTGSAVLIDGHPNPTPEAGVWLPVVGALGLFFWQRRRPSAKQSLVA